MKRALIMIVVLFVFILGCFSATPYKKLKGGEGYADEHIKDSIYVVTFKGNGLTDRATCTKYAFRRAEEVCKENGYGDYKLLNETQTGSVNARFGYEYPTVTVTIQCVK